MRRCDETIAAAVAASKETGVMVVVDTIGVRDQAATPARWSGWALIRFISITAPTSAAPTPRADSTQWLTEVTAAVKVPVGAGTFGVDDGMAAAARLGADHRHRPSAHFLRRSAGRIREYCHKVRAAYVPRKGAAMTTPKKNRTADSA